MFLFSWETVKQPCPFLREGRRQGGSSAAPQGTGLSLGCILQPPHTVGAIFLGGRRSMLNLSPRPLGSRLGTLSEEGRPWATSWALPSTGACGV